MLFLSHRTGPATLEHTQASLLGDERYTVQYQNAGHGIHGPLSPMEDSMPTPSTWVRTS